ncbi:dihydrodipicolinate reductase [Salibaculum sp.]|uniref:dihydrodipicolinate reductase n=1 Tax=Salibaculum sp. TaxID=2855480 RepID=UPI002B484D4D|nr:dihydrodipicolinate reductase [Salibaculum sp.]HKL69027.1 dihydrodipicolinate reductase [Salibaculum sp.]
MRGIFFAFILCVSGGTVAAFERVDDKGRFLDLVADKELRLGLFGVSLHVGEEGTISGSAAGWDLTGTWAWHDGYFCREIDWSGTEISYNCQLVEHRNGERIRFTVDQGAGRQATFSLR